jgi:hypothetical protein
MTEDELVKLLTVLIKFRTEVLEQTDEMKLYVKQIGWERDRQRNDDVNTKEIAYVQYFSFETRQLN